MNIQNEYNKIYEYFKTTTEPFDFLHWNGSDLEVWYNGNVIETYTLQDIKNMLGKNF